MIPFRMYLIFKTRCNTYNILTYRFFAKCQNFVSCFIHSIRLLLVYIQYYMILFYIMICMHKYTDTG